MNRKLFFILDKLHVTRQERIAIQTLLILIIIVSAIKPFIEAKPNYDPEEYEQLEAAFLERAEFVKQKEREFLARFEADTSKPKPITKSKTKAVQLDSTSKININTAPLDDLIKLPGIGKAYAERIIDYRNTNGDFASVDDLVKIKGIGVSRLKKLKPYISVLTKPD